MTYSLIQQARDIAADQYIRLQMKEPNPDQSLFAWARHIQEYSDFMRGGSYDDDIAVQSAIAAMLPKVGA